jgi:hypothetical protein
LSVRSALDTVGEGCILHRRHAETSEPIPCPSLRAKRSNPGAAVRPSGLLPPRMLWPLDCFVARAPRNDGWVAADPIASVVIGRRLRVGKFAKGLEHGTHSGGHRTEILGEDLTLEQRERTQAFDEGHSRRALPVVMFVNKFECCFIIFSNGANCSNNRSDMIVAYSFSDFLYSRGVTRLRRRNEDVRGSSENSPRRRPCGELKLLTVHAQNRRGSSHLAARSVLLIGRHVDSANVGFHPIRPLPSADPDG